MTEPAGDPGWPRTLLVIGTGLLGTSIGLAATAAGIVVWLEDLDPAMAATAATRGAGQIGRPDTDPDLVVVAVPPNATAQVIVAAATDFPSSTLSDISSVKAGVLREVERLTSQLTRYVPGHPIAGGEAPGPTAARADLFQDRPWVLTPTADADPDRVEQVRSFVRTMGAVVVELAPDEHDRAVALTSHTPQLVSSLLAARFADVGPDEVRLTGQGLRDTTRIAASDAALWAQILSANAAPVASVLRQLQGDLERVLESLAVLSDTGDREADRDDAARAAAADVLTDLIRQGNRGRARMPTKHGQPSQQGQPGQEVVTISVLTVLVDDRPGELARLFQTAGRASVNLEDVRIDHALGRPTGLVELTIGTADLVRFRSELQSESWQVSG